MSSPSSASPTGRDPNWQIRSGARENTGPRSLERPRGGRRRIPRRNINQTNVEHDRVNDTSMRREKRTRRRPCWKMPQPQNADEMYAMERQRRADLELSRFLQQQDLLREQELQMRMQVPIQMEQQRQQQQMQIQLQLQREHDAQVLYLMQWQWQQQQYESFMLLQHQQRHHHHQEQNQEPTWPTPFNPMLAMLPLNNPSSGMQMNFAHLPNQTPTIGYDELQDTTPIEFAPELFLNDNSVLLPTGFEIKNPNVTDPDPYDHF